jgi:protein-L-isoaspartate(D-aspartate) O-methyltransferase
VSTPAQLRRGLVAELEKLGVVTTPAVRAAFLATPRERFVPAFAKSDGLAAVYRNDVVVTRKDASGGAVSSSSAPSIMAVMLEQLELDRGHRVLEVGAGTGYNAALLKRIVGPSGRITTIDIDPVTTREARAHLRGADAAALVVTGDGRKGHRRGAPYDRIIVTASATFIPKAWYSQLAPDGLIVLPLFLREGVYWPQLAVALRKVKGGLESTSVAACGFMALRDSAEAPATGVPYIDISMKGIGQDRVIAAMTGEALRDLDDKRLHRLLSLVLGDARRRAIHVRGTGGGLHAFLALAGPQKRQLVGTMGLMDRNARSFAYIGSKKGRFTLRAAGTPAAENELLRLIDRWRALGSPELSDLRMRVTYGRTPPRAWRTIERGPSYVSFDWSSRERRS